MITGRVHVCGAGFLVSFQDTRGEEFDTAGPFEDERDALEVALRGADDVYTVRAGGAW